MIKNIKNFAAYLLLSVLLAVAPQVGAGGVTAPANSGDIKTVGSQASASDIVLTASAAQYQSIAMTAMGKSVWLDDARQVINGVGGPRRIIRNTGGYPFGIRDNGGTLLSAVTPGGIAYLTLESASTAAGSWGVTGTGLEPGLVTIDQTLSSTYSGLVLAPFVALDDNTSIHFAALSSGFAAFVVDRMGKSVGAPVPVYSGAGTLLTAFKINATQALCFYADNTSTTNAVVLTISGSSPSLSLAVGAAAASAVAADTSGENFTGAPKIVQLSSSLYLYSFAKSTPRTSVVAVSVSGDTVTFGTAADIITAGSVAGSTTTYALTATTALALYKSTSGPYANNAVIVSVSGVACTIGTSATILSNSALAAPSISALLSPTKALVIDDAGNATGVMNAYALTITGTDISAGSPLNVETNSTTLQNRSSYTQDSATRYNPHLFPLSANTALLWYLDSSGVSRAVVLTENVGTVTPGAKLYKSISANSAGNAGFGYPFPQGVSEFLSLVNRKATASGIFSAVVPHKISGTQISVGRTISIDTQEVAYAYSLTRLSPGKYVVTGSQNASSWNGFEVISSNGDVASYLGKIAAPPMTNSNVAPAAVVSNNWIVALGTVQQGNTVGAGASQLRILGVEFAQ